MTTTRSLLIFGLGLLVLALGAGAWFLTGSGPRGVATSGSVVTSGQAKVGGPFALIDQHGESRSDADFRGRHMLIYFGFTFCPDICPTSLMAMTRALDQLEESAPALAERIVPIFITVDPERDTVEANRLYAEHFHPRLVALTGSEAQIASAAKAYRVYYRKAESSSASDYLVDHSSFVYLMDGDGNYVTHFAHNASAEEMAEKLVGYVGS
ncbi:MAG: SCO family protein [Kiloniellales bacterium]|nr:SCO family protein [Kiloniellales bacterium]